MQIQKVLSEGSNFDLFFGGLFLVDEGKGGIKILLYVGHHRQASEKAFKWRFAGVPVMAQHRILLGRFVIVMGSGAVLLRNPLFLLIFQRGMAPVPPPPL